MCFFVVNMTIKLDYILHLINAKSRVAPLKKTTIPRFKLLACFTGAHFTLIVKKAMNLEETASLLAIPLIHSHFTTMLQYLIFYLHGGSFNDTFKKIFNLCSNVFWSFGFWMLIFTWLFILIVIDCFSFMYIRIYLYLEI